MAKAKTAKDPSQGARWSYIGISAFLIALGVCAVVWPDLGLEALCVAIGVGAVLFGVIRVIVYFMREVRGVALSYDFSIGTLAMLGGVILLIRPRSVLDFLQVVIGVYLLLDSVFKLQISLDSKRLGMTGWWVPLIFTAACLALGVLMVLRIGADFLMTLIGAALIADGLQNLCLALYSAAAARQLKRMDKDGDGLADLNAGGETPASPTEPEPEPLAPPVFDTSTPTATEEILPGVPLDAPADDERSYINGNT